MRRCRFSFYYFFFFQAEDGIRDLYVTGVQTCALPISRIDVDAAVRRMRGRFDPNTLCAKVVAGDRAAGLAHERRDLVRDVTQIDGVAGGHDRVGPSAALVGPLDRGQP